MFFFWNILTSKVEIFQKRLQQDNCQTLIFIFPPIQGLWRNWIISVNCVFVISLKRNIWILKTICFIFCFLPHMAQATKSSNSTNNFLKERCDNFQERKKKDLSYFKHWIYQISVFIAKHNCKLILNFLYRKLIQVNRYF